MLNNALFLHDGDKVFPGKQVGRNMQGFIQGEGIYKKDNFLFAGVQGFFRQEKIEESSSTSSQAEYKLRISGVKGTERAPHSIRIGDEVYGRVEKIRDDAVFVTILCINGQPTEQFYDGILRKKDIKESEVDKLKTEDMFLPDDIIKARVHSYGDSKKIQLSTIEDIHGVVFAKSQNNKRLMFPLNWSDMVCPQSKMIEKRKVAKPDDLNLVLGD